MIQGAAGLRAEPAASRLTNPTTSEMHKRFGAKRQKITVTLGHRRSDSALIRARFQGE
jgi:hypothetical protein